MECMENTKFLAEGMIRKTNMKKVLLGNLFPSDSAKLQAKKSRTFHSLLFCSILYNIYCVVIIFVEGKIWKTNVN